MAEPKGIYFSPTGTETGWATVLPERPHRSYANLFAKDIAAQRKAAAAEDKAKQAALAKLRGGDVGKLYHRVYQNHLDQVLADAPNRSAFELESEAIKLDNVRQATKSVSKIYDDGIKWINDKKNPVKQNELNQWWASRFANPTLESAAALAESTPLPTEFLDEKGASKYIDIGRATKMVIKDQFQGYTRDNTEWKRSGWESSPFGAVADINTFQTKVQAFSKYDPNTNEVVMKSPTELVNDVILEPFLQNEYTKAAINDRARAIYAERKEMDINEVDDLDIEAGDQALALQEMLTPYVQGVIAERGMTLAIRPSGGGAGRQVKRESFEMFTQHLSQAFPAALDWAIGGRWGETKDTVIGASSIGVSSTARGAQGERGIPGAVSVITADPASVRRNYEQHKWFQDLSEPQKNEIVTKAAAATKPYAGQAKVLYTFVLASPVTKKMAAKKEDYGLIVEEDVTYKVITLDPSKTNTSIIAALYEAGRGAKSGEYIDFVGEEGSRQMGYPYQQAQGWQGNNPPAPNNASANPLNLIPNQ